MEIKQFLRKRPSVVVTSTLVSVASLAYVLDEGLKPVAPEIAFFYASIIAMTAYTVYGILWCDRGKDFLLRSNLFLWFSSSFLASRLFVRVAGIGSPASSEGSIWFIPLNQLWIADYHLHHYFFGLALIVASNFVLLHRGKKSGLRAEVLFGAGLGLLFDEIGFLLSMGNYDSLATYPLTLAMAVAMFVYANLPSSRD